MKTSEMCVIMMVQYISSGRIYNKMIRFLKRVANIGMGTRAISLLLSTGIPVLLYGLYIFACVTLGKYGIIEAKTYELTVMLESEALALAMSVGGVLLMDTEEKNVEKK